MVSPLLKFGNFEGYTRPTFLGRLEFTERMIRYSQRNEWEQEDIVQPKQAFPRAAMLEEVVGTEVEQVTGWSQRSRCG